MTCWRVLRRRRRAHAVRPARRRAGRRTPRRPRRRPRCAALLDRHPTSTRRGSTTSASATPTRPARTTATSPAWRCCSPGCRRRCPAARSTGCAAPASRPSIGASRAVAVGDADDRGRRWRRVDEPRALGDAQARRAVRPRARAAVVDHARLADGQPARCRSSGRSRSARAPRSWPTATASRARRRTSSRSRHHRNAARRGTSGVFADQVVPVAGVDLDRDEGIRADSSIEALAQAQAGLPPGRHRHRRQLVTAERRRRGAAARRSRRRRLARREPLARIVATGVARRRPGRLRDRPGRGRARRAGAGRDRRGPTWSRVELNEAFAVAGAGVPGRVARPRPVDRQRQRRRDRDRPSARRLRRTHRRGARTRAATPRWRVRVWPRSASASAKASPSSFNADRARNHGRSRTQSATAGSRWIRAALAHSWHVRGLVVAVLLLDARRLRAGRRAHAPAAGTSPARRARRRGTRPARPPTSRRRRPRRRVRSPTGRKYGGQSITTGPPSSETSTLPTQVTVDHLRTAASTAANAARSRCDLLEGRRRPQPARRPPTRPGRRRPGIGALVEESRPLQPHVCRWNASPADRISSGSHVIRALRPGTNRAPPSRRTPTCRPETEVRAALRPRHRQARREDVADPLCSTGLSTGLRTIGRRSRCVPGRRKSAQPDPSAPNVCDDVVGRDNHVDRLRGSRQSESAHTDSHDRREV